jgi:hypothetical protein
LNGGWSMMEARPMAIVPFTIQRHHSAYGGRPFLIDQCPRPTHQA